MKLNRKNLKIIGLIGLIFLVIASFSIVSSHQPQLVNGAITITNPIIVENPEISQAF